MKKPQIVPVGIRLLVTLGTPQVPGSRTLQIAGKKLQTRTRSVISPDDPDL